MLWIGKIARHLAVILLTLLLGGLFAATLVRLAPGFDVDEQQLNVQLSEATIQALRQRRARDSNIMQFYFGYLHRAAHGDLGESQTLDRPVRGLIAERLPVTLRLCALGLLVGWAVALALACSATLVRAAGYEMLTTALGSTFLSVPAAVLALLFVVFNAPTFLAVACVIFPKVFRYARNLLAKSYAMPHIITARAKGLGNTRILLWHVLPTSAGQLLALAGVSVSIALGACVPVEALCGIPGIGQLAWQAALGRDLPLLVTLTVLVTVVTLGANSISDLLHEAVRVKA